MDYCANIFLGGGEPFLEVEMIEYITDKVIKRGWTDVTIQVTTNGTVLDERITNAFAKFCSVEKKNLAHIRVSNDRFHSGYDYWSAVRYYREQSAANPMIMVSLASLLETIEIIRKSPVPIVYAGRAKAYIDKLEKTKGPQPKEWQSMYNHRIKIEGGHVRCLLKVSANGKVGFSDMQEYEVFDNLSFGNVLDSSLENLVDKNNDQCLLTCLEHGQLVEAEGKCRGAFVTATNALSEFGMLTAIYRLRDYAHKQYPFIPAQAIIESIPFPKREEYMSLLDAIEDDYVEAEATLLESNNYQAASPVVFGECMPTIYEDCGIVKAYKKRVLQLAMLNSQYQSGTIESDNTKILACDIGEGKNGSPAPSLIEGFMLMAQMAAKLITGIPR